LVGFLGSPWIWTSDPWTSPSCCWRSCHLAELWRPGVFLDAVR
jgi:hypothetical protein